MRTSTGEVTEDDGSIAQEMNTAFNGVYVREDSTQPTINPDAIYHGPKLQEIVTTGEGVKKKLKKLDGSKAA
ncbi:hypothetical protein Pcinc_010903, partial [Petrolisthes cinctipes]